LWALEWAWHLWALEWAWHIGRVRVGVDTDLGVMGRGFVGVRVGVQIFIFGSIDRYVFFWTNR